MKIAIRTAALDIKSGLLLAPVWLNLAWMETKQRYRRSTLGPLWITISMGLMLAGMGPLYGMLLKQELGSYFQSLAIGFVLWNFISNSLNDSTAAFVSSEGFIKQVKLPYSLYLLKVITRNLIILLHNTLVIVLILIVFPPATLIYIPFALAGIIAISLTLTWAGMSIAILCTRYRDVAQIVANVVQILFFLTPILWTVELLGSRKSFADWNIFYHLIEIVRRPLLGYPASLLSWSVVAVTSVMGATLSFFLFSRVRTRISYWL
jgi:ABC-type polysaccharide/polyol phosphate export permease